MAKGPERLLKWMLDPSFDLDHPAQVDIAWAADEIESLRATLKDIKDICDNRDQREGLSVWSGFLMIRGKCVRALEGEP